MKTNYLSALKQMVLSHLGNENVKVLLFGSRARNDNHPASMWILQLFRAKDLTE
jgi:hypothetical protein